MRVTTLGTARGTTRRTTRSTTRITTRSTALGDGLPLLLTPRGRWGGGGGRTGTGTRYLLIVDVLNSHAHVVGLSGVALAFLLNPA